MYKIRCPHLGLEISHSGGDLRAHVYEVGEFELLSFGALKELEETSVPHEFGDDVNRLLHRTNGVELNQLRVPKLLHDTRLSCKGEEEEG